MSQSIKHKHQRIFQASILLSILLHIAELHFLQRQALWFASPTQMQTEESCWSAGMERESRTQILKEAFTSPISSSQKLLKTPLLSPHELAAKEEFSPPLFTLEPEFSLPSFDPKEARVSTYFLPSTPQLFSIPRAESALREPPPEPHAHVEPQKLRGVSLTAKFEEPLSYSIPSPFAPAALEVKGRSDAPSSPKLPSLAELHTIPYSAFFDTELVFHQVEDGRYFFALTLIPKPTLKLTPFKQNYLFLIDRSNSIQKERLQSTVHAVHKALEELEAGDRFNIFVFDQKLDKLSSTALSFSPESIAKARRFLDKVELGSFFSQTNLFKPLALALPPAETNEELYTAILLTDGGSLGGSRDVYDLVSQWTQMNGGKTSLYALSLSSDANLSALQTITHLNRGKVMTSATNRGIKRKLLKLIKTIHSPVAKNISCRAISRSASSPVEILPHSSQSSHLYLYEPYTIVGMTHSLDDFVLFVQGKLNGKWLHIKKQISFLSAKRGDRSLQTEWVEHKALALYQQYLQNQNPKFLSEAQELLAEHDLPGLIESQRIFGYGLERK